MKFLIFYQQNRQSRKGVVELLNTHNLLLGEVRLGEALDHLSRYWPSLRPSPPKGIGDVYWMHSGGEEASLPPLGSWAFLGDLPDSEISHDV